MLTVQDFIEKLNSFWSSKGCSILQSFDVQVGAGTSHPATAIRCLGPDPWNVAYVQASTRPTDGRYTKNPIRNQRYYQYQVLLKPSPENIVDLYLESLEYLGFDTKKNDIKFIEDDWENPTLGASGVGWEVSLNATEISQFTFFQQMGGFECESVCAELTYGPERLVLMLNDEKSFWEDLKWSNNLSYSEAERFSEEEGCIYNFEIADVDMLKKMFDMYEAESRRTSDTEIFWDKNHQFWTSIQNENCENPLGRRLVFPAYELALKCGHVFNLLDARGAISVNERAQYIQRVRALVRNCCKNYLAQYKEPAKTK